MKFFAWVYLLPMAVYWMMFVYFNWHPPEHLKNLDLDFIDRTALAMFKQGIMFFAGLHLYFWYKWKDK